MQAVDKDARDARDAFIAKLPSAYPTAEQPLACGLIRGVLDKLLVNNKSSLYVFKYPGENASLVRLRPAGMEVPKAGQPDIPYYASRPRIESSLAFLLVFRQMLCATEIELKNRWHVPVAATWQRAALVDKLLVFVSPDIDAQEDDALKTQDIKAACLRAYCVFVIDQRDGLPNATTVPRDIGTDKYVEWGYKFFSDGPAVIPDTGGVTRST